MSSYFPSLRDNFPSQASDEEEWTESDSDGGLSMLARKRRRLLSQINLWHPTRCCRKNCAFQIGIEELRSLRERFLDAGRDERKEMLTMFVKEVESETRITVNGYEPCRKLLMDSLDVSTTMISNVLELPSANASRLPGRNFGTDGSTTMKSGVISFLQALANDIADEIPNRPERHLPHGNKHLVYMLYQDDQLKYSKRPCKSSHFYTVWKDFMSHIKCRRRHSFSVCDDCTSFKEELSLLARKTGHHVRRARLKRGFRNHLRMVQIERATCRQVQEQAFDRSDEVLSVIIDGADQAKFGLPRFPTQTKRESGRAMKQKITGVLFHGGLGRKDFLCFLTSSDTIPAGSNQTIDALCRCLLMLMEKRNNAGSRKIPSELNIQLDNTTKDNKNRYFFAFCEYLVYIGLFSRVNVRFLPVGHTHEDIDRKFSRVSVYMQDKVTATVEDLHKALKNSQSKSDTFIFRVNGMHNFSGAMNSQNVLVNQVPNMLSYRMFVFEKEAIQRESDHHENGTRNNVVSFAANEMSAIRENWIRLSSRADFIGSFLKAEPNFQLSGPVRLTKYTQQDISDFEKRIRLTESRIRSAEKVQALRQELENAISNEWGYSDWNFQKILDLANLACDSGHDGALQEGNDSSSDDVEDPLEYEKGEMVTVNCNSNIRSVTPFWLARIENVLKERNGSVELEVRWYEICGKTVAERNCWSGKYREKRGRNAVNKIPSASVLVCFEELTMQGTIPEFVRRLTQESLDPFSRE